jgi:hypothetical protein
MAQLNDLLVTGDAKVLGKIQGTVTKAEQDGNGNNIASTYLPKSGGTMSGGLTLDNDSDLVLKANSSDPGDIVFKDGSGNEIGRIWKEAQNNTFNIRFGEYDTVKQLIHSGNIGSQSVNYATSAGSATKASQLSGVYTSNGGSQPPSYVGANAVKCNMMDSFIGTDVASFESYADVLQMNAYSWSDVPYATALAIQKTNGVPRAWIAAGGNTYKWAGATEIITKNNIGSQSVNYANSAGAVAWGNVSGKPGTFPPSSHTHTKSQITDFPTSLPASDVYSWAKASSKPSYAWSEITSKPTSFTPANHTQAASTITGLATVATSGNYSDLSGKPTSLPASDVYSWAKASSKPSYTASEVGAAPAYQYSTTDLTAGSSPLTTGTLYFVYE